MTSSNNLIVGTEYGKVRGKERTSCLGENFLSFKGIPFAKPPVGELRFKDPQPPSHYDDVLDATEEKPGCLAYNSWLGKYDGSEDCLYLNVYVKNLKPTKPYPVMVNIYGGAFKSGSGTEQLYGPDFFLMHDVILVTFNYRLGPLGFLSLDSKDLNVPGNAGLKDQLMALKWVKNNIKYFGGDPENVTLFGHSAGGCSVHYHCISEKSKGLFQKAVLMSGTALNEWGVVPRYNWASKLAKNADYTESDTEQKVLEYLQTIDALKVVQAQENILTPEDRKLGVHFPFAPVIEPYICESTFVPEHPILTSRKAWGNELPIMIGGTSEEGLIQMPDIKERPETLKYLELEDFIPLEVKNKKIDDKLLKEFASKLKECYYKNSDHKTDERSYYEVMDEKIFWHGMHRVILSRRKYAKNASTYLYRFSMDSPTQNFYRIRKCGPDVRGVCHADEIGYLFKNFVYDKPPAESPEFDVIKKMVSVFTSFAATGNPNNPELKNVVWDPVDNDLPPWKCLDISDDTKFIKLPETENLAVWDSIYTDSGMELC